jgi:hypothetical protein
MPVTKQIPEVLYYEGDKVALCSQPLDDYFALSQIRTGLRHTCTALYRGYVATWDIQHERLYLIGLSATRDDGTQANVATFFPNYPDRVFAHWYSGELRIPQGNQLTNSNGYWGGNYERDLFISVDKGVITETLTKINGVSSKQSGVEGYGASAMTVFSKNKLP